MATLRGTRAWFMQPGKIYSSYLVLYYLKIFPLDANLKGHKGMVHAAR